MKTTNADHLVDDFKDTLVVIPCSGRKVRCPETCLAGRSILDDLPAQLAPRLVEARRHVTNEARVDSSCLMPAWKRYCGFLYRAMGSILRTAIQRGHLPHLLILSGGYGVLHAKEPIGWYNRSLHPRDWPPNLFQDVFAAYVKKHALRRARLFATATSPYATVLRREVRSVGYEMDVLLFTPERVSNAGAQRNAPRALGQVLAAMLNGTFDDSWRSADGLTLHGEPLSWV